MLCQFLILLASLRENNPFLAVETLSFLDMLVSNVCHLLFKIFYSSHMLKGNRRKEEMKSETIDIRL